MQGIPSLGSSQQGGASNACTNKEHLLDGVANRFFDRSGELFDAAQRLNQLADRTVGPEPKGGGACGSETPAPSNAVGKLEEANRRLNAGLQALIGAVIRLEEL